MDKEDLGTSLNEELDKIKDINDLQQYVCQFEEIIQKTIDSKIPEESKLVVEREKKVWFSEEIRNQRQITRRRETIWKRYRQDHQRKALSVERNRLNRMLKNEKITKISELIEES